MRLRKVFWQVVTHSTKTPIGKEGENVFWGDAWKSATGSWALAGFLKSCWDLHHWQLPFSERPFPQAFISFLPSRNLPSCLDSSAMSLKSIWENLYPSFFRCFVEAVCFRRCNPNIVLNRGTLLTCYGHIAYWIYLIPDVDVNWPRLNLIPAVILLFFVHDLVHIIFSSKSLYSPSFYFNFTLVSL